MHFEPAQAEEALRKYLAKDQLLLKEQINQTKILENLFEELGVVFEKIYVEKILKNPRIKAEKKQTLLKEHGL